MKIKSFLSYNTQLKSYARSLRNNATLSEVLLWEHLKGKQLLGLKFRRQVPVGKYIVDFYCKELRLAIEIDGFSHDSKMDYDNSRQKIIESFGVAILRFSDIDIKNDIENVVQRIIDWIDANPPLPRPSGESN